MLNKYYVFRIFYVAAIVAGAGLVVNTLMVQNGYEQMVANTVTLNIIVFGKMFYLFNVRSERGFALNKNFFTNKVAFIVSGILLVLQLGITYLPFMHTVFKTAPMDLVNWLNPLLLGVLVFTVVEVEKYIKRTFFA